MSGAFGDVGVGVADRLLSAIDDVYAGALDHDRLTAGIGRVAEVVGASGAFLYTRCPGENGLRFAKFSKIDLSALHSVDAATAQKIDQLALRVPLGHVQVIAANWPIAEMRKSPFYRTYFEGAGIVHGAAAMLQRNTIRYSQLTMCRTERQNAFESEQLSALQIVLPHFQNVLRIHTALGAAEGAREAFAAVLDNLPDGVILTDKTGRVIHLNRAAQRIIASNDGLSIKCERFTVEQPDEERTLEKLVGQASAQTKDSFARGGTCAIGRPSGALPWLVLAVPCGDRQASAYAPLSPACTVIVRDSAQRGQSVDSLRHVFGLTPQEAKVASEVARGCGLAEAAQTLGLSALTVRNHLQRVFAKTGVRRQAELARLLAPLA